MNGLIAITYPGCPHVAKFVHSDAAVAFLRTMAGQITASDFVSVVVATSGTAYEALARTFISACLGQPV